MAFIRTALIIGALLLGWTALRHQGVAGSAAATPAVVIPPVPSGTAG